MPLNDKQQNTVIVRSRDYRTRASTFTSKTYD